MTLSLAHRITAQQQVLRRPAAPPPPAKRMHCVDVSNYTDTLTGEALAAWQDDHDVGLVIVQAVDPPPPYPTTKTRKQIQACVVMDMPVDVYVYLWTNSNVEEDMRMKLALLNGLEAHVRWLWLDIEDEAAASVEQRIRAIRQALAVLDGWCVAHNKPAAGVYSSRYYWLSFLGNPQEFSARLLWVANYDWVDDASVFKPFGGWTRCAIKQYIGSTSLAGINGVDLNILNGGI